MFKIFDGREHFYQWDLDRKIIVSDASISQVHFCNKTDDEALVVEVYELDGKRVADVPNILLQNVWRICVYAWDSNYTKHMARFDVVERSKPATYVYTETEILNYETLLEKIEKMDSDIAGVVDEYLKENPPEIEVDLSDYYTKAQTDKVVSDAVAAIDIPTVPDVSEFITMEDVENKGYLTEHQQLKTINGESIVGSGNIVIEGGTAAASVSWDDIEDKPFYTTVADIVVAKDETIDTNSSYDNGKIELYNGQADGLKGSYTVYADKDYYVSFDGVEYRCRFEIMRYKTDTNVDKEEICIGNKYLFMADFADTGEPFFVKFTEDYRDDSGLQIVMVYNAPVYCLESGTHSIVITELAAEAEIVPIPDRYLPSGLLTTESLEPYALKTEIPSLDGYALASDIPDVSGFALKTDIPIVPDVSGFTTMSEVEAKGYQTEAEVNALIDAALGVIENGTY